VGPQLATGGDQGLVVAAFQLVVRHSPTLLGQGYRYWPVFATVSIERPGSVPCLPVMSVRMKTIRSPFLPEMRAQSSGFVVFGRSSFSLNSSTHAVSRWEMRSPFCPVSRNSLIAIFFAR